MKSFLLSIGIGLLISMPALLAMEHDQLYVFKPSNHNIVTIKPSFPSEDMDLSLGDNNSLTHNTITTINFSLSFDCQNLEQSGDNLLTGDGHLIILCNNPPPKPPTSFEDLWKKVAESLKKYNEKTSSTRSKSSTFAVAYTHAWKDLNQQITRSSDLMLQSISYTTPASAFAVARCLWNQLKKQYQYPIYDENTVVGENKELPSSTRRPTKAFKSAATQLITSIEITENLCFTLIKVIRALQEHFPKYSNEIYEQAAHACIAMHDWRKAICKDQEHLAFNLLDQEGCDQMFLDSLLHTGKISFLLFVCPTVDFSLLTSETPEDYVQTTLKNSFLLKQTNSLANLIEKFLAPTGVKISLLAMIGDSDEDDYMWPTLGTSLHTSTLDVDRLTKRRMLFLSTVEKHLSEKLPTAKITVQSVASLSRTQKMEYVFKKVSTKPDQFFDPADISREKERMRELWGPQEYYADLPKPNDEHLSSIVADKFAAYATHGLLAYKQNPCSVLIQTEFPSLLRTKMMNTGRKALSLPLIPAIYLHYSSNL